MKVLSFILLHAESFVYKCRLNHLKLLKIIVKYIYEADKHVQLIEMTYEKFIKKWTPYSQLVT